MIQRDIEDAISEKILMGDLEDGQRVRVDAEGEGILGELRSPARPSKSRTRRIIRRRRPKRLLKPMPATEPTASTELADSAQSQN